MNKNEYPEHLNPFAEEKPKRSGGGGLKLSSSFREFTKTLRKSFRIKKKEKNKEPDVEPVQIRPKVFHSPGSTPLPTAQTRVTFPTPLPRSRFQERLTKTYRQSYDNGTQSNGTLPKNIDVEMPPGYNPFEEEEEVRTIRRRAKKRAPLPPKSVSSQNINSDVSMYNKSNWSLTSVDTSFTGSTDNMSIGTNALAETLATMNKEIQKLCDDSNNNKIPINNEERNVVPDVVVSCANDGKVVCENEETDNDVIVKDITHNLQNPDKEITIVKEEHISNERLNNDFDEKEEEEEENPSIIEKIEDTTTKQEIDNINQEKDEEIKDIKEDKCEEIKNSIIDEVDSVQVKKEYEVHKTKEIVTKEDVREEEEDIEPIRKHVEVDLEIQAKTAAIAEIDDEVEPTPKSIVINGDITNNNSFAPKDDIPDIDEYLEYNERLSLYIAGSTDELNNYTEKNLYIKGSKDNLDDDKTTNIVVPKQRKNKLTKDSLLGTNNN